MVNAGSNQDEAAIHKRFQRLEPLLDRALELDGEQRQRFLAILAEVHPDLIQDLHRALNPDANLPALGGLAQDLSRHHTTNRTGLRIGAWRLKEKIGHGGMGSVYRAERADGSFDKEVAIKLLRGEDARFGQHLERERQLLARLDHPGIARLIDGGMLPDGKPWLAMELAAGEDLAAWLRRTQPPLERRLTVFLAICDAVCHAHREHLVHRDLKPGNIRIDHDDSIKLLDFGIAKLVSPELPDGSTRQIAITPEYAAPEQFGSGRISTRTDVYALGALLHMLLAGRSPHPRFDGNWAAYIEQLRAHELAPVSQVVSHAGNLALSATELRGDLDAIVAKALARDPRQRYASVADMAIDIRHYLQDVPVGARVNTWRYRLGKWLRRNRGLLKVLLVFVLILVGIGLGLIRMFSG